MLQKNLASWTASIAAQCTQGNPHEALKIFSLMLSSEFEDVSANGYILSVALKACAMSREFRLGRQIHHQIVVADLVSDTVLMNSLLGFYVQCGNLLEAKKVFDRIPITSTNSWNIMMSAFFNYGQSDEAERIFSNISNPDTVSFNTVIAGFSKMASPKALEFLRLMQRFDHKLDEFTLPCALKVCGDLRFGRIGRQIHCQLIKSGIKSYHCESSLIQMYSCCSSVDEAEKLFEETVHPRGEARNLLAVFNAMISGYGSNGRNRSALRLVSRTHERGFALDGFTLSAAARACAELQDRRLGLQIHGMIVASGLLFDPAVGTLLMEMYVRSGNLDQATAVFDLLPKRDAITWGTLICGCSELGSNRLGLTLFKKMTTEESGHSPDEFILSSVLKSLAGAADLDGGRQVHGLAIKLGFSGETTAETSLIDMYSKCGEVEDGLAVFRASSCRDTATWTAIIVGCAINGKPRESLAFLQAMTEQGVEPNELTFTGALTACRHGGLLEEACSIFGSMQIPPSLEHRHLMMDLLSRGGRFAEAKDLFDRMPENPTDSTWNLLISGARTEAEIRAVMGDNAAATSAHVTISNVLAALGAWDDAALAREAARGRGTTKEPGVSRIDIRV